MKVIKALLYIGMALTLFSCSNGKTGKTSSSSTKKEGEHCAYYWKTTFSWDSWIERFTEKNHITRIYLRMFDVALETNWDTGIREPQPIATTRFENCSIPKQISIVPVVYITLDALKAMAGEEGEYAKLIVTRVKAMMEYNNLGKLSEMQLDCDWTSTTRKIYFCLCDKIRSNLNQGCRLTSTIRLHQLDEEMPNVDRGVLMLYNTGSFTNPDESNSILTYENVLPYVRGAKCSIPLDFAYPAYDWGLLFRDDKFRCIIRMPDLPDGCFDKLPDSTYVAAKDCTIEGHSVCKGDVIRIEHSHFSEIEKVKDLVESKFGKSGYSTFIYHLDSLNLSKYTDNEIKKIYSLD